MKSFMSKLNQLTDTALTIFAGMYMFLMCIICLVFFICHLDPSVTFDSNPDDDWIAGGMVIAALIPLILLLILRMLDGIIRHASGEITNGDHVIRRFFFNHLFEYDEYVYGLKREFNFIQVGMFLGVMASVGFAFMVLALNYPWLFIFPMGWGIYVALVKLGKFVYNVSRSLERHKTDPNAHKGE